MLTDKEKHQIILGILDLVKSFSDKTYQKETWIRGGEFGYAYDDHICDFYSSSRRHP